MKTVLEFPVWIAPSSPRRDCSQSLVSCYLLTGCSRDGYAAALPRIGEQSALPGIEPSTYSTKGSSREHGNLNPSAGYAKLGELPSPVMSRMRGRAPVVVRARESRVRGEGRQ